MFFIVTIINIFTYEIYDIEGVWIEQDDYNNYISNNEKKEYRKILNYKFLPYSSIIFITNNKKDNVFQLSGYAPMFIFELNKKNDFEFIGYGASEIEIFNNGGNEYFFNILFRNIDQILLETDFYISMKNEKKYWYRISGPAKISPLNAIINDTRVRLRTKPTIESDTWGFLNTGDNVVIKDKTDEKFTIDGESWYWYKVDAEGYPDGWVYGKYVDVEKLCCRLDSF